jgi:hypothetical protein
MLDSLKKALSWKKKPQAPPPAAEPTPEPIAPPQDPIIFYDPDKKPPKPKQMPFGWM